jgi:formate hydrogenlyase subunit 4
MSILEVLAVTIPVLLTVAFITIAERKTMASMQRRLGPNAVGWYGLLQAFADALKLLLKEYVSPTQANIFLFFLGPIITLIFSLLGYAVIPYGPGLMLMDYNLGILYLLAMSSLATYGILLAGLMISPLIMIIISKTSGEFQEKLVKSQLEAKYSLIFLTYLFSIRYGIAFIFNKLSYWLDYKCSTTSKWDSRKVDIFTTSAWNLIIIIIFFY